MSPETTWLVSTKSANIRTMISVGIRRMGTDADVESRSTKASSLKGIVHGGEIKAERSLSNLFIGKE